MELSGAELLSERRNMSRAVAWVAALLVTLCGTVQAVDVDRELTEIFDAAWKPSIRGLQMAQSQYDELVRQTPGDMRVKYAFALVLMKNRRYEDASKLLGDILAVDKSHLPARRAKAWINMLTKKYPAALVDLDHLSQQLPPESNDDVENQYRDAAAFMGRMFAFLEGPAQNAVANHTLADYQAKICGRLGGARLSAYNTAFRATADRFAELTQSQAQTKADAKAEGAEQQARDKEDLEQNKAALAEEQNALQARADKAKADTQKEVADLEIKARPLQTQLARLQSEANMWANNLAAAQSDINLLLSQASMTNDPNEQAFLRGQAGAISVNADRFAFNLQRVNNQIAGVNQQLAVLEGQRQASVGRYQAEMGRIDGRNADLRKTEKRLGFDERKLKEPVTGLTPRVRNMSLVAGALPTYDDFPFEEERERVMRKQ